MGHSEHGSSDQDGRQQAEAAFDGTLHIATEGGFLDDAGRGRGDQQERHNRWGERLPDREASAPEAPRSGLARRLYLRSSEVSSGGPAPLR